jgi:hypothetical protein
VLVGPQSRYGYWESRGEKHREVIYKECIFVWIVPGDFNPTFPQLPPSQAMGIANILSSRGVRVYAGLSNYIADSNRWNQIMNNINQNGGSLSQPDPRVSWKTWVEDIATALKK